MGLLLHLGVFTPWRVEVELKSHLYYARKEGADLKIGGGGAILFKCAFWPLAMAEGMVRNPTNLMGCRGRCLPFSLIVGAWFSLDLYTYQHKLNPCECPHTQVH